MLKHGHKKNGVTVLTYEKVAHDTIPEGQVISQSIEPETDFNPKTRNFTITVSTGPGITVPNLNSMTIEEIKTWATKMKYHCYFLKNTIIPLLLIQLLNQISLQEI